MYEVKVNRKNKNKIKIHQMIQTRYEVLYERKRKWKWGRKTGRGAQENKYMKR